MIRPLVAHACAEFLRKRAEAVFGDDRCAEVAQELINAMADLGVDVIGSAAQNDDGLMLLFCRKTPPLPAADGRRVPPVRGRGRQYLAMLLPLLICEVTWSLGENVYAAIYGRMGTDASAAMTLTAPVQGLVIGALCGLSQPPMRRAGACSSTALPGPRCCPCSWCCSAVSMWRSIRWRTG